MARDRARAGRRHAGRLGPPPDGRRAALARRHGESCLDVGTADGFWAFELERRGAAEVVAIDPPSAFQSKARRRFELAAELRASSVAYEERSVYDVEGEFDVVFMGFVLQMPRDPVRRWRSSARLAADIYCCSTP